MRSYITRIYTKRQISDNSSRQEEQSAQSIPPRRQQWRLITKKSAIESGRSAPSSNMEMPTCGELVDEGEGLVVVGHFGDWTGEHGQRQEEKRRGRAEIVAG